VSEPLLRLNGVSKTYPPTVRPGERFRAFWQILTRGQSTGGTNVLEDIGFEIRPGQSMGIIGANGAGKSTLLKIITGVLAPSSGVIERRGTSAALLELGAGFDVEYTGLENLHMNAAFLGLSREQIAENLDNILAFADIGESIHEPVKHYSSGMVVRLGFAVVASVRPDLLITDEVLAVGDESFQKKCIRWIEDYLARGGTLLMVSHNMYQVQKLCHQAMWLDGGRARSHGDVFDVTQAYLAWHERRDAEEVLSHTPHDNPDLYASKRLSVQGMEQGEPRVAMGEELVVEVEAGSPDGREPVVVIGIVRADGTPVYGVGNDFDEVPLEPVDQRRFRARFVLPKVSLLPGGYAVRGHVLDPEGLRLHDTREMGFTVTGKTREVGLVRLEHQWRQ
jgi:lipopolysaccharide transport system ATP-binding protein